MPDEERDLAWHDWQERNRLQDLRGVALRVKLMKYASMAVLLLAVVFWRYDWASLFVGMAVLYNPVFPLFVLSGRVGFFLVIASITAFAASLFLLKPRLTPSVAGH